MLKTIAAMLGKQTTNQNEKEPADMAITAQQQSQNLLDQYKRELMYGNQELARQYYEAYRRQQDMEQKVIAQSAYANVGLGIQQNTPGQISNQTYTTSTTAAGSSWINASGAVGNVTLHTTVRFNQMATALVAIKSNWRLSEDVAKMSDEAIMSLWAAKYSGGMVRPFADVDPVPKGLADDERMMLSITLFLTMRGYLERQDDFLNDAQVFKPTPLGEKLLYGDPD